MISAKQFAASGYKYLGRLYSEMDCQEFVERCLKDCGLNMNLSGSNAWYREMDWVGTPEECKTTFGSVPEGAFLFILSDNGKEPEKYKPDGIGNASHIGFKTDRSPGAIHSSSSKGKVAESAFNDKTIKNGGWNRVGLYKKLDYGEYINNILNGKKVEPMKMKVSRTPTTSPDSTTVRVRITPNGAELFSIRFGETVEVDRTDGAWSHLNYNGRTGWMKSEFLKDPSQGYDDMLPEKVRPIVEKLANLHDEETKLWDSLFQIVGRG